MNYLKNLEEIVLINSHTPNKDGVDKVGFVLSKWFEELNFEKNTYKRELIGDHLHFKSKHKKNHKKLLLLGHIDTVFPKGHFETFREDDVWVYGPGVCDMKGGLVVAIEALKRVYKHYGEIFNIDFLIVSDEETGSDDSNELTKKIAVDYDYCMVFEAAGENLEVVTARKGVGKYIVDIKGKAAHAGTSYKKGIDANLEGALKLQNYTKLSDFDKGTVLNVGMIEGGIGINTVSPYCKLSMEFRFNSFEEKKRILEEIENISRTNFIENTSTKAFCIIQREVMVETKEQLEFLKLLENITNEKFKKEHRGGVSDANIVSNCNVPTIDGFGPFGDGDHTKKERALKSSFEQRINLSHKVFDYFQKNLIQE